MLRYAVIAAIPIALAASAPAYPQHQPPSETRLESQFQGLIEANKKMMSVLGAQKQQKSYGDHFKISETIFGQEYHDLVFVPAFETGIEKHVISTYLTESPSGNVRYTIFVDRLNVQGNGKIPAVLEIFDLPFDRQKGHRGHRTIDSLPFGLALPISSFLDAMWDVVNRQLYLKWGPESGGNDGELESLVKKMEAEMNNLSRFAPNYSPKPTSTF